SARTFSASFALSDIMTTLAPDASQPAPESIEAPSDSIVRAISGADIASVPLVNKSPIMLAVPARCGGSISAPLRTTTWAARSGRSCRSTTITRKPFWSLVSFGAANFVTWVAEGAGGVSTPLIAQAERTNVRQRASATKLAIPHRRGTEKSLAIASANFRWEKIVNREGEIPGRLQDSGWKLFFRNFVRRLIRISSPPLPAPQV